ncbi:hypothetical protein STRAU_3069 [Streptomyces aurantiacus JA 4570]|uniref:Uncharacterized protein n=1 Tax=Streptomyces aurantiacus JA 4570 TaxID=1286094 RepID=S3ZJV2_9ACTN|nr:hypothetical protein STRAU_3069 [Streptomyces aurantiacus JA 4570]
MGGTHTHTHLGEEVGRAAAWEQVVAVGQIASMVTSST